MDRWKKQRRLDLLAKTTPAEKAAIANMKRLGLKVVCQLPIETGRRLFFADIAIPAMRLLVEIDGGYHNSTKQRRLDRNRSACLRRKGWRVARLTNRDARDFRKVAAKIVRMCK